VDTVCKYNEDLRSKVNVILGETWGKVVREIKKEDIKKVEQRGTGKSPRRNQMVREFPVGSWLRSASESL
jgi:hypothetical protein